MNPAKTVESITLPDNKNVTVMAMTVVNVTAAAPLVSASNNAPGTFTFGGSAVSGRLAPVSIE